MKQPQYPNLMCTSHNKIEPGYILCKHVKKPDDIQMLEYATETSMGVVCCLLCAANSQDTQYILDNCITACAKGLKEMGLIGDIN